MYETWIGELTEGYRTWRQDAVNREQGRIHQAELQEVNLVGAREELARATRRLEELEATATGEGEDLIDSAEDSEEEDPEGLDHDRLTPPPPSPDVQEVSWDSD
jgi:ATP phosphoribosyltransferase regulatory subunit HisZ